MSNEESVATVAIDDTASPVRILLTGNVGAYHSDELYFTCLTALERGRPVDVDCAGVKHLGGSTVQLLIALARGLEQCGQPLQLVGVPPPVAALLGTAGVLDALRSGGAR